MSDQSINREDQIKAARTSFSGKTLTESQFQNAWAISGIVHTEIRKTGSFRDTLTDYSHAFARGEKFDALRGETIIRDVYQGRYALTMNQTREALMGREKDLLLDQNTQAHALQYAEKVPELIKEGPTQPFYKAYDQAAILLSRDLNITQSGAKALIKDAYQNAHERDLYEAGKEVEEAYHKPVREAEIAARKQDQLESRGQTQSRARSMS